MYIWIRINLATEGLFRIKPNRRASECVQWTPDTFAATVQHLSIDHRRRHIFVTQQFLNPTDVIAIPQQIGAMESHRIANAIA